MRETIRKITLCACAVIFLLLSGGTSIARGEDAAALPIDFSGGMPLQEQFFTGTWKYKDPTISVSVKKGRTADNCDYWIASIKIAHASQLRTAAWSNFETNMEDEGARLAKRVNAVVAIDGDYFCYTGEGYIMRQGKLFLNVLRGRRDVLLVDEDGDFHVVEYAKKGELSSTINGKNVINAFYFGPALVLDGKVNWNMDLRDDMRAEEKKQRMCIAQVGPLEYKCICCGPPARGSTGMTLLEFAKLVAAQGVQTAYNLDGGNSCMMFFNGVKINDTENTEGRKITDIVYFASAYGAGQ